MYRIEATTLAAFALIMMCASASATNLLAVSYDSASDEVVVDVAYRGSGGKHSFSLDWSACEGDGSDDAPFTLSAALIDAQAAQSGAQEFTQQLRFPLSALECRPATLTVRTATGANRTIALPAAP